MEEQRIDKVMTNKHIPTLRFKDFDDEWENDELNKFTQLNPKSDLPEQFEYVDLESVVGTELISHRTEIKETAPSRAQRLAKKGDVFYQMVRPYQKNNYLFDLDKEDYVFSTGYAQLRPTDKLKSDFLLASLQIDKFVSRVLDRSTGTSYPAINSKDLSKLTINIPSLPEQSAIGSLFQTLDELLSAYKDNLANHQAFKAAMLSKMFPRAGQTAPEIRLDGFDGEWETGRADEIFQTISDKDHPDLPVLSATQTNGMVYRDDVGIDIKYDEASLSGYKRVLPEQFVIHLRSFQGGFAQSKIEGITSPAYTIIDFVDKNAHSSNYWAIVFASKNFIKQLETVTYGIRDGKSISFTDFSSLKFTYASVEEQQAIGSFFSDLDTLISSYQEKINQLETLKKKLLKDMFV